MNDLLRNPLPSNLTEPEAMRPPRGSGRYVHSDRRDEATATTTTMTTKQPNPRFKGDLNPNHFKNYRLYELMRKKSDRWKYDGLNDIAYEVLQDKMIPRESEKADGFFEIHHIKVLAQQQGTTTNTNTHWITDTSRLRSSLSQENTSWIKDTSRRRSSLSQENFLSVGNVRGASRQRTRLPPTIN